MQFVALIPILASLLLDREKYDQARWWTWTFVVWSMIAYFMAPLLYSYVPTEYSSVVAFTGSVTQAFVVLEAMFIVVKPKIKNS